MGWGYSEVRRVRLCRLGVSVQCIVLWRLYPELPLTAFCPALLVLMLLGVLVRLMEVGSWMSLAGTEHWNSCPDLRLETLGEEKHGEGP